MPGSRYVARLVRALDGNPHGGCKATAQSVRPALCTRLKAFLQACKKARKTKVFLDESQHPSLRTVSYFGVTP